MACGACGGEGDDAYDPHLRGSVKPANPPATSILVTWPHDLHDRWSLMARDERTEAEMTIPSSRTKRAIDEACEGRRSLSAHDEMIAEDVATYAEFAEWNDA